MGAMGHRLTPNPALPIEPSQILRDEPDDPAAFCY